MTRFAYIFWELLFLGSWSASSLHADECPNPASAFEYHGSNAKIGGENWTDTLMTTAEEILALSAKQLSVAKMDAKGLETMRFKLPDAHLRPVQIAVQPNGRILVAGIHTVPTGRGMLNYRLQILGFDAEGKLDAKFGNAGTFEYPSITGFLSIAVRCDGGIVLAFDHGYKTLFNNLRYEFVTLRLTENGLIDRSFGARGTSALRIGKIWNSPESLVLRNDGSILVGGQSHTNKNWQSLVFNLNVNGAKNASFGENGISRIYSFTNNGSIRSMAEMENGQIAATGINTSTNHVSIAKLNSDGNLDQSFANNGIAYAETPSIEGETLFFTANSVQSLNEGGFLVGGKLSSQDRARNYYLVTKFKSNGVISKEFGTQGHIAIPLPNFQSGAELMGFECGDFVVIADGRQTTTASVHRFDSNGKLVANF
jgi:uncharacterized delta-60 repeat protein